MTWGDKIRAMTDEELVDVIGCYRVCEHTHENCGECMLAWLKQEATP